MKIAVAQIRSPNGEIKGGVENHIRFISSAAEQSVDYLLFPELSLTGYELKIASSLALQKNDNQLNVFSQLAKQHEMCISVGMPLNLNGFVHIAAVIFVPDGRDEIYAKMNLHGEENAYFTRGEDTCVVTCAGQRVFNAICADTCEHEHYALCGEAGASVYAAGVLVSKAGYTADARIWAEQSKHQSILLAVANYTGRTGGYDAVGRSAIWYNGQLLAEADESAEALVMASVTHGKWSGYVQNL